MDNIIENILAIDRAATEIIKKAEVAKQRVLDETAVERSRLLDEAATKLNEKVEEYRKVADDDLAERVKEIEKIYSEKKEKLCTTFNAKCTAIEDDIVDKLIRGEDIV